MRRSAPSFSDNHNCAIDGSVAILILLGVLFVRSDCTALPNMSNAAVNSGSSSSPNGVSSTPLVRRMNRSFSAQASRALMC